MARTPPKLAMMLSGYFSTKLSNLDEPQRKAVEREKLLAGQWDRCTPSERQLLVEQLDTQRSRDPKVEELGELAFRYGYKKATKPKRDARVRARNSKNSKKDRPSTQRVTSETIRTLDKALGREGWPSYGRCAEAYRRYRAGTKNPISSAGWRARWNRLGLKGGKAT
jgi:hypothetical protein